MSKKKKLAIRAVYCKVNEDGAIYWAWKDDNDETIIPTTIYMCQDWYEKTDIPAKGMTFKRWCTSFDL